jgi:ribosomal protein S6--L-glutamate ligase
MVFGFTRDVNRIERLLLRPWVGTCYQTFDAGLNFPPPESWTTIHAAHGLPMPTTVHGLGTQQRDLETLVDTLGGFPIVIKEEGLSQGRGVRLVRNFDELRAAAASQPKAGVTIARRYIDTRFSTRVVVVGGRVAFCYRYEAPAGDFRSNARLWPSVTRTECAPDARSVALKAVSLLGLTCGGVDLLQDRRGQWLLLEVNFPFNFATPDLVLKANVAGALVEELSSRASSTCTMPCGLRRTYADHRQ